MGLLSANNISVKYEQCLAVDDVSLNIQSGEMVTIVGPNGSGKSTILKVLARVLKPIAGNVYLNDEDVRMIKTKEIAKKMAILPQIRRIPEDFSVETLVAYGRYPHTRWVGGLTRQDKDMIHWALTKTGMLHLKDKKMNKLSGGEQQRAWIAMALAQKPELLILDEPTTFLDLSHQIEVLELLSHLNEAENLTILMVLHDLNQAIRYSNKLYVMDKGKLVTKGHPEEIITNELLYHVFNVDADFLKDARKNCKHLIPYKVG